MKRCLSNCKKWLQYLFVVLPFLFSGNAFSQTLRHSFTFEDGTATDVVGSLTATTVGDNITIADGKATVSGAEGNNDGYIALDASALALNTFTSGITIEAHIQTGEMLNTEFTMLCYFGDSLQGENAFWIQPARSGETNSQVAAHNGTLRASAILAGTEVDDGLFHHLVATIDNSSLKYYLDGVEVASVDTLGSITGSFIEAIGTDIAHIFRGPTGWPDPNYNASLEEFNIYSGVMSPATVATNALKFDNDGDLLANDVDNCPDDANPDQLDYNNNGIGNACDPEQPAYLTGISTDVGELLPAFDQDVFNYSIFAPIGTTSVTLTATASDGALTVAGDGAFDVSSGSATAEIVVSGDGFATLTYKVSIAVLTECYEQYYPDATNLIPDPELTSMDNFPTSWSVDYPTPGIVTDPSLVYCGTSSAYVQGSCFPEGGSLNTLLNDSLGTKLMPNTSYRVRAAVKNETGGDQGFHFQIEGYDGSQSTFIDIPEAMGWQIVDGSFKTGETTADGGIFFNSCMDAQGLAITATLEDTAFIDNYELLAVPDNEAGLYVQSVSAGTLDVRNNPEVMEYNVELPYGTQEVFSTVQPVDLDATVSGVDTVDVSSGSGTTTITVTARDGSTTKTYTINYEWAAVAVLGDLSVENGSLSPNFDLNVTEYVAYANMGATSLTLSADPASAEFSVAGELTLDLSSGSDTTELTVTGEGFGTTVYTVIGIPLVHKHGYTFEDGTFADGVVNDQVGELDGSILGSMIKIDSGRAIVRGATTNTDGYIQFDAAALAINTYKAITLEFQVQSFDVANSTFTMLSYFGNNTGGQRTLWYQPTRSGNESRAEISTGGGGGVASLPGTEIDDSYFHHIAVVVTQDSIKYFLDGEKVASTATGGNAIPDLDTQVANLFKGADSWADPNYNGALEEFNIFDGAMDEASIAARSKKFDADNDGVEDSLDNCPETPNTSQSDRDGDGVGDFCDDDFKVAALSDITVEGGSILPEFDPFELEYFVYAYFGVNEVTVTGIADNAYTVEGDGTITLTDGRGSASITVSGEGFDPQTYTISVIGVDIQHAYTFDEDASDQEGDLDGQIQGAGVIENGSFVSANDGDGVAFDGAALALNSYDAITLETFFIASDANTGYHMLNYFGGASGADAYWVQPARQDDNLARVTYSGAVSADFEILDNDYHHIVTTLTNEELTFYIDGVFIGSTIPGNTISAISTANAYLCLSGWPDPSFQGRILEFNIYEGVMDAAAVAERANLFDYDEDGIVNDDDDDDDNDGMTDVNEIACGSDPLDPNDTAADEDGDGIPDCQELDNDEDGIANFEDNCPETANADQADMDNDGIGDVCDPDRDGDGIANEEDSCPDAVNIGDADEDGIDDVCDDLSASNILVGELAFGTVNTGSSATKNFNIINQGVDQLEVTAITGPAGYSFDKTSFTVDGESLAIVKVTFNPSTPGDYSGEITVESNGGTETIAVSGTAEGDGIMSTNPADINLKLGPNPVNDQLMIDWTATNFKNPSIRVINIDGKVIWTAQDVKQKVMNIDVSEVAQGLFFIQIQSEGKSHMFKMIKQ